ncbi:hypothetical protein [Aquabacterium sp.]|uniref:hypothetical protein n=1 Tax=Aquabacterium sp. TaxID=1872578 RepID=UPI002C59B074|nr:hypothetical protein [Aquabacterium sp.]HSW03456.1 hypothetical protein [Aquabacterium sp.]
MDGDSQRVSRAAHGLVHWLLVALLVAPGVALLAALWLAIDSAPQVARRDDVSPADIDRAVAVARLHDPRRAAIGQLRRVPLSERDVDLLVYQAARRWLRADTQVRLHTGRMLLQASVAAPLGAWLNIELTLLQIGELPVVERLRVGRLPLPASWALPVLRAVAERRGVQTDALLAVDWIERVSISSGRLMISYRLGPDTLNRLRAALVAPMDQQRLRAYSDRLAMLANEVSGNEVSMARLLPPLMALAAERSAAASAAGSTASGDAAAENRAALLTLTFYANHRPLGLVVPAAYGWPRPRPLHVTLQQRHDLPLHFLISALIAAESGTPLADAVGLWKELADARQGGSGFSFNDLAADLAGTRFGERAVREPLRLQARLAAGAQEADWMPAASDLPESLPEAEFLARYGGIGGAGYQRLLAEIEARVAALPVLR